MRSIKRKFLAVILVVMMFMMNTFMVSAAENQKEAVYDLEKGGIQTFVVEGKDGEAHRITIEQVDTDARVADDTYKVKTETSGWTAGFYIKVSNNKITSAYSPFHTALRGSIESPSLVRNSNVKVTYSFIYKWLLLSYNTGVVASISDSSLIVTQK